MTRTRIAVVAALVVAVIVAAVLLALRGDTEPGTDAHVDIDPITTADEVAVAVMGGVHTWTPDEQQSPWDAMHALSDRLTGPMAEAASTRPEPDPSPRTWDAWARSGDRVIGAAELAVGQDPVSAQATSVERIVDVHQKVLHPDGATTPLEAITVSVELEQRNDQWKVAEYHYESVGPDQ